MTRRDGMGWVGSSLKLDTMISSDSSTDLSAEMKYLEFESSSPKRITGQRQKPTKNKPDMRNPQSSVRHTMENGSRCMPQGSMDVLPPPPPPPGVLSPRRKFQHNTYSNTTTCTENDSRGTLSKSQKSSQENALISLLKEMRAMEQKIIKSTEEHAKERQALMDVMARQGKYIESLEQNIASKKTALGKILRQLDRFATGCSKFPSASVKKLSDALHHQVNEWDKNFDIDVVGANTAATSDQSTMEKLQSLHFELKELKHENHVLKERLRRSGGKVDTCMKIDNSDEVSHLSGMTSTSKLINAMSGFLNDFESNRLTHGLTSPRTRVRNEVIPLNDVPERNENALKVSSPLCGDRSLKPMSRYSSSSGNQRSHPQLKHDSRSKTTVQMNTTPQILSPKSIRNQKSHCHVYTERSSVKVSWDDSSQKSQWRRPMTIQTLGFNEDFGDENGHVWEDGESEV